MVSIDTLREARFGDDATAQALATVSSFQQFIHAHRDQIAALPRTGAAALRRMAGGAAAGRADIHPRAALVAGPHRRAHRRQPGGGAGGPGLRRVLQACILAERRAHWARANPGKRYVEPQGVDAEGFAALPEGWVWATRWSS